jgi:hypothetical protein
VQQIPLLSAEATPPADARPQAHRHELTQSNRELKVHFIGLRQVRQALGQATFDPPGDLNTPSRQSR